MLCNTFQRQHAGQQDADCIMNKTNTNKSCNALRLTAIVLNLLAAQDAHSVTDHQLTACIIPGSCFQHIKSAMRSTHLADGHNLD